MEETRGNVLVIGDMMVDYTVYGQVTRFAPEAYVPVFKQDNQGRAAAPGGAARVAYLLGSLSYDIAVAGLLGDDGEGRELNDILEKNNVEVVKGAPIRFTTVKTRFVEPATGRILFRYDRDSEGMFSPLEQDFILDRIRTYRLVVLSDYNKGVLTKEFTRKVITRCRQVGVPVIVDVKVADVGKYSGATVLKGNREEISALIGAPITVELLHMLAVKTESRLVCVTLGEDGILAVDRSGKVVRVGSRRVEAKVLYGAGDVVTASLAYAMLGDYSLEEALRFAASAAALAVSRPELELSSTTVDRFQNKFLYREELAQFTDGKKVVFTNGCFDVIHPGHVELLRRAREMGDILVVGVNDDASVKRLKGEGRPINPLSDRVRVLAGLESVDFIVPFSEDTPLELIETIRPAVLVKGGDYTPDEIVGAREVRSRGGRVRIVPLVPDCSTTRIIEKAHGTEK